MKLKIGKIIRKKILEWLLQDGLPPIKIGESTVIIDGNSITLPALNADPALTAGKLWFRSDLGRLKIALSSTSSKVVPTVPISPDDWSATPDGVGFAYHSAKGNIALEIHATAGSIPAGVASVTSTSFTDYRIKAVVVDDTGILLRMIDLANYYKSCIDADKTTGDHFIVKVDGVYGGSLTLLASEAVDLATDSHHLLEAQIQGSTLSSKRDNVATITATDTALSSGKFGVHSLASGGVHSIDSNMTMFLQPASPGPKAQAIIELPITGSGTEDDPFRPELLVRQKTIDLSMNVPRFLKRELKKYSMLKLRGFSDEEIEFLLGYRPQTKVDVLAVTWGGFEIYIDAPSCIITIFGDNPYVDGAVQKQVEYAKTRYRSVSPPKDYREAVEIYRSMSSDFNWLAGKDNFAYQTLGEDVFVKFANADFYYGELIEHKTHYAQLRNVPDEFIRARINGYIRALEKVDVLTDERDKHIGKLKKVLSLGW